MSYARRGRDVERSLGGIQRDGRQWFLIGVRPSDTGMNFVTSMEPPNTGPFHKETKLIDVLRGFLLVITLGQ